MTEALPTAIEIVSAPFGEAPLWVREAWIGLILPLAEPRAAATFTVGGVLTMPRSLFGLWWGSLTRRFVRVEGYLVPSATAIELLAAKVPVAAEWWRREVPRFLHPNQMFVFDAPACRPLP